jgi:hypothetical protein
VIVPVEVWDYPVAGRMLQEWRDDPAFPARVAEVVAAAYPDIAHVHLMGGGADDRFVDALAARGIATTREPDPFAAARAGAALRGACADVGQTGIKLASGTRTWRVARDLARAPMRDDVPLADRPAARATTIAFLADALRGLGKAALVGLPCEIAADVPRSCTYCWPDPDPALVADLARASGVAIEIVNDAELAALAAERDPRVPPGTCLVLTIGFGVGAAVLTGTRPTRPA